MSKTTAVTLPNAQAAIVAMLKECGLRQVQINVKPQHNRYSKQGTNVYYRFTHLAPLAHSNNL